MAVLVLSSLSRDTEADSKWEGFSTLNRQYRFSLKSLSYMKI